MIYKQFVYYTLLACFSVSLSEQENQNEQRFVRGRYSFNRPPNFEKYNPLLVLPDVEGTLQDAKTLQNGATSTRSLKDVTIDTKAGRGNIRKSNKKKSNQYVESDEILHESGSQQSSATVVSESDKSQGNTNVKTKQEALPSRRSRVRKFKSEINATNEVNDRSLRNHVPVAILPVDDSQNKNVDVQKIPIKTGSKRSRERKPFIPIIENENFVYSHTGDFHYSYESGDGTKAFERGELKTFEDKTAGEAVVGSFSYTDKDGNDFSLSYTADENGYRPKGAHLPTPPPIPPEIARALLYLSTKTTPQPATESYFK